MIILMALVSAALLVLPVLLPVVTELPFGMEEPLSVFISQINIIISVFPPMAVVWNVILIGISVKLTLVTLQVTWAILKFIRGG